MGTNKNSENELAGNGSLNPEQLATAAHECSPDFARSWFDNTSDPLCGVDDANLIITQNTAFNRLFLQRTTEHPLSLIDLVHPDDEHRLCHALRSARSALRTGMPAYRLLVKTGEYRYFSLTMVRPPSSDATLIGAYDNTEIVLQSHLHEMAIEGSHDGIVISDANQADLPIIYASSGFLKFTGYDRDEIVGKNCRFLQGPDTDPETVRKIREAIDNATTFTGEILNYHKNGDAFWNLLRISPVRDEEGKLTHFVGSQIDITDLKKAQEATRIQAQVFANLNDSVIITDLEGHIRDWNTSAQRLFGYSRTEVLGKIADTLSNLKHLVRQDSHLLSELHFCKHKRTTAIYTPDYGTSRIFEAFVTLLHNEKQSPLGVLWIHRDITEEHRLTQKLVHQASHDELTGLINRREFERQLDQLLEDAKTHDRKHALCYLDLDQFKLINDTSGHVAGDEMLRQLASELRGTVRKNDVLARLGGDEFGLLIRDCSLEFAEKNARDICDKIRDFRFYWDTKIYTVGVSIGLVEVAQHSGSPVEVLSHADSACYAAKDKGRNRTHVYHHEDLEMQQRFGEMQWVSRIKEALRENKFQLFKQNIYNSADQQGEHSELLLRMEDDDGELICPDTFLPAAERYDLATDLDQWVFKRVLDWFDHHPKELHTQGKYFVNLSGHSLGHHSFLHLLSKHFEDNPPLAKKICFEITETASIVNLTRAMQFMDELSKFGCSFALDDFGSGFSSFAYLKNLKVDFIKIDGFFVKGAEHDPISMAMVRSINDIGHAMGKRIIAECVEDQRLIQKLHDIGIDYLQGFALDAPTFWH